MSGRELVDVVCPVCSGRGPDPGPPTWDVQCLYCTWRYTDDWGLTSDPLLNEGQVMQVIKDHNFRCQGYADVDSDDSLTDYMVLDPGSFHWLSAADSLFIDMARALDVGKKKETG